MKAVELPKEPNYEQSFWDGLSRMADPFENVEFQDERFIVIYHRSKSLIQAGTIDWLLQTPKLVKHIVLKDKPAGVSKEARLKSTKDV